MTDWDLDQVGYVEMDLVLHCGASTAGEYGHSLSALEIGSAWWEGEVVMGRAQSRIFDALKEIRARSPFTWRGIDSDNDNAFINDQLYQYTETGAPGLHPVPALPQERQRLHRAEELPREKNSISPSCRAKTICHGDRL